MLHWAIFDLCMGYKSFWVAFQNGGDLKLIWRLFCLSFCFQCEPVKFLVKNFAMLELKLELNRNNMLRISTISMIDMQRKMDRRFIVYEFKYFYWKGCFFFNALTNIPKSLVPSQKRIEERLTSTLDVKSNLKLTSYGVGSRLIFPVCSFLTSRRSVKRRWGAFNTDSPQKLFIGQN